MFLSDNWKCICVIVAWLYLLDNWKCICAIDEWLYLLDYWKCICAKGLGRGLPLPRCELLRLCSSASAAGLASRAGVRCNYVLLLSLEFMDWHFQWGNDNWATVGRILIIYRPLWNFNSDKMGKNQPSSTSASACAQNLHYAHCGFWPLLAIFCPKVLRFFWAHFFILEHINMKLSGINQHC